MQEKKCKPLTEKFINEFLLEAQHHSGLPLINSMSLHYFQGLHTEKCPDDLLPTLMDSLINNYMILVHEVHKRNKTWKSYDW